MQVLRCSRKPLDENWVKSETARIVEQLKSLGPSQIFHFGSSQENRMTDQSDFDFLLLFESEDQIKKAIRSLRPHLPLSQFPVDIIWKTQAEYERKKDLGGVCYIVHREGSCVFDANREGQCDQIAQVQ